jgi:hypothetical protein
MESRFREDYAGEFVILETKWGRGKKTEKREWIENPLINQHISGRAACIGNSAQKFLFDYTRLQNHRGGLLSSLRLQTYGVGPVSLEMRLDFAVESNPELLEQLKTGPYYEHTVTYTTARNCINNPGLFYIVPYQPHLVDIAQLLYLAAFDGHKKIFMLGYNINTVVENDHWIDQVTQVINAYPLVTFYPIGEPSNVPTQWTDLGNVKPMDIREFVSYCDI